MALNLQPNSSQDVPLEPRLTTLHDDALALICEAIYNLPRENIVNFSCTCKRMRRVAGPYVHRHTRTLTDCADGYSRLPSIVPWLDVLDDPENADKWVRHLRVLKIRMVATLERDVGRLASILARAKHLEHLELSTPKALETNQDKLRRVMVDSGHRRLKTFTTTAGLEDLLSALLITEHLIIRNESYRTVDPYLLEHFAIEGRLNHIVSLELDASTYWTPALLGALAGNLPALRTLGIVTGGRDSFAFETLIQASRPFPQLKELTVASVEWLSLRAYSPTCNQPRSTCDPPNRFCSYHTRTAFQYAGKLVLIAYPQLELLRFEDEKYKRREGGQEYRYVSEIVMEFRPAEVDGQRTMYRQFRTGGRGQWKTVYD